MLSAAASPRCRCSLTPVRRFNGPTSMSIPAMNETNPPTVTWSAPDCSIAMYTMTASASAAMSPIIAMLTDDAATCFMRKRRRLSAFCASRPAS